MLQMYRALSIGCLWIAVTAFPGYKEYKEINSINELPLYVPHDGTGIVVSDLDNTITQPDTVRKNPDEQYGSEQWGAAEVDRRKENGVPLKEAIQQVQDEYADYLKNTMNPELVEDTTASVLKQISGYAPVYVLTSRRAEFKDASLKHIQKLGLSSVIYDAHDEESGLDAIDDSQESDNEKPLYACGVTFVGKHHKGDALLRLLHKKYGYIPHDKHVVFVDDKKSSVDKVLARCQEYNVSCTGLRYTACDASIRRVYGDGPLP